MRLLREGIETPTLMLYADSDSALGLPLLKVPAFEISCCSNMVGPTRLVHTVWTM